MRWRALRSLLVFGAALGSAGLVMAQKAPPIKPGLWEVQTERNGEGAKMPDMSERLAKMPPEERKKIEAMMKQRGIDISQSSAGRMSLKLCLTRESLDKDRWHNERSGCKTQYLSQTSSAWKWHTVCEDSEMDGEANFPSAETYNVKLDMTSRGGGAEKKSQMKMNSKWLGADCGDVKPINPGTAR